MLLQGQVDQQLELEIGSAWPHTVFSSNSTPISVMINPYAHSQSGFLQALAKVSQLLVIKAQIENVFRVIQRLCWLLSPDSDLPLWYTSE